MNSLLIAKFFKDNWRGFVYLGAALFVLYAINSYLDATYERGRNSGITDTTKLWKEKYDKDVGALNKKISDVEAKSRENADLAKKQLAEADARVSVLQEDIKKQRAKYDNAIYNMKGAVVCASEESLYLGPAFSLRWNELNKEIVK